MRSRCAWRWSATSRPPTMPIRCWSASGQARSGHRDPVPPGRGEGEWIEVRNLLARGTASSRPLRLSGSFAGHRSRGDAGAALAPGSLRGAGAGPGRAAAGLPTAGSRTRPARAHRGRRSTTRDDASGVADVVTLAEADAVCRCSRVTYSAEGVRSGATLEFADRKLAALPDAGHAARAAARAPAHTRRVPAEPRRVTRPARR